MNNLCQSLIKIRLVLEDQKKLIFNFYWFIIVPVLLTYLYGYLLIYFNLSKSVMGSIQIVTYLLTH